MGSRTRVKCHQNPQTGRYANCQSWWSILHGFSVYRLLGIRVRQPHRRLVWKQVEIRFFRIHGLSFSQLVEDDGSLTSILKSSRLWYLPSIICACGWMGGQSMRNVEGQTAWFTQYRARESLGKYLGWDQTDVMWYVLNTDLYIHAFYYSPLANDALNVKQFVLLL